MSEFKLLSRTTKLFAVLAVIVAFGGGYVTGIRGLFAGNIPNQALAAVGVEKMPAGVDFDQLWKAWRIIDEKFVPAGISTTTDQATTTEDINNEKLWGMIAGLASSLNDPYTFFLPPQEQEAFNDELSGSFEGVGMEIAVKDNVLTVVSPLKGTPAEKANILAGDKILKIDEKDTKGLDVSTAVKRIRGPKGTVVKLFMYRDGWKEPKTVEVTRDVINIPIVTTKKRDDGVFVITLASFTSNSTDLFRNALKEFSDTKYDKLVIDVRGNPGGYLEAAVDMASWFLPEGKVVVTEDYAGHRENVVHRSRGYNIFTDKLKMVILVDKGSASASEILAGALKDYGKAKLVGTQTFGKGSVQELVDITDKTSLKITVARWILPNGSNITGEGIAPDVEVKVDEKDKEKGRDTQLERAAEFLVKGK
jgi:carboxyl-terminal processing protease